MAAKPRRQFARRIVRGLVVTREVGEDIQIDLPSDPEELKQLAGQAIIVQLVRIDRGSVRVLTQAPENCKIRRGELVVADAA